MTQIIDLSALTTVAAADLVVVRDDSATEDKKVTFANFEGSLGHDNLSGVVANQHIDHSSVTITAGAGLTGGGDISASRTFNVGGLTDSEIAAGAEIAVSKIADGTARQLLQTDAAGTGVEWASNIVIPGTLDVTGAVTLDDDLTFSGGGTITVEGDIADAFLVNLTADSSSRRVFTVHRSGVIKFNVLSEGTTFDTLFRVGSSEALRIEDNADVGVRNTLTFWDGSNYSVNLYASAANTLKTDDSFVAAGDLTVDSAATGSGSVFGGATGGAQGAGTINAVGVYDDGSILSDYVLDLHYDGKTEDDVPEWWQGPYGLPWTGKVMETERRLPWMPTRDEWAENKQSLGSLVSRLWAGQEQVALHVQELATREDRLESALRELIEHNPDLPGAGEARALLN